MKSIYLVLLSLTVFGGVSTALKCRTGFNTTILQTPIEFWQEQNCSSISSQKCFIQELSFDMEETSIFNDVQIVYGGCISDALLSEIECTKLESDDGLNPDLIESLLPVLQSQVSGIVTNIANETAQNIANLTQNRQLALELLKRINITVPENLNKIIGNIENVLINLFSNNQTAINQSAHELLASFSTLNTSDERANELLQKYFDLYNITFDDKYKPLVENLPWFIAIAFNQTGNDSFVYTILESLSNPIMNTTQLLEQIDMLDHLTPEMRAFFELLDGFFQVSSTGDPQAIAQYAVQALFNTAVATNASQEVGEALIAYLKQFNITVDSQTEQIIVALPGLLNAIFPNQTDALSMIFGNITSELNKINITNFNSFEYSLNSTLQTLAMANITLPQETINFLMNLQELFNALQMNDSNKIFEWSRNQMLQFYPVITDSGKALITAFVNVTEMMTNMAVEPHIELIIEYAVRIPLNMFPNNITLIDMIYQNITDQLNMINLTSFDPSTATAGFDAIDMSAIPAELQPLLNATQQLIMALLANDTQKVQEITQQLMAQSCVVNNETMALTNAVIADLTSSGVNVTMEIAGAIQCLPGIVYSFFPNQTEMANAILQEITLSFTNYTQFLRNMFDKNNITLPQEFYDAIENQQKILAALGTGNMTEVYLVWLEGYKQTAVETELSMLLEYILVNMYAQNLTEMDLVVLRNSAASVYSGQPAEMVAALDLLFSTMRAELMTGKNIGHALAGGLVSINVTVSQTLNETLSNLHFLLDVILGNTSALGDINCMSNDVTQSFASALFDSLVSQGLNLTEGYKIVFECVPGTLLAFYPAMTDELNQIFNNITTSLNMNQTEMLQMLLKDFNITLPPELIQAQQQLMGALESGNITEVLALLEKFYKESSQETELSKFVVAVFTKVGFNLTEDQIIQIQYQTISYYYYMDNATLDAFFGSLNKDLSTGAGTEKAVENAFKAINKTVPAWAKPLSANFDQLIHGFTTKNGTAINLAVIEILEDYSTTYPEINLELIILQVKLNMAFQMSNGIINDEIIEIMAMIYHGNLKQVNITHEQFVTYVVNNLFPELKPYLNILINIDPRNVIKFTSEIFGWIFNPDREVETLFGIINGTIHNILDNQNTSMALKQLLSPDGCNVATCNTDLCNEYGILPRTTATAAPTTTPETTTTVPVASTTSFTTTAAVTTTTTSDMGIVVSRSSSWFMLVASLLISKFLEIF